MAEIVNIPINQLHPHPKNPRKNLGDLTELAASIRAKGIMQNLTVVPGHYLSDAEMKQLNAQYAADPDEELRVLINKRWAPSEYTVVIGHRRRAAAEIAEKSELPCAISDMDEHEQVATMLMENLQRADLTVYEQAQGFQMMMDFGETPDSIAAKTGFSESTVRHRLNIAKLDAATLKKIEGEGGFQLSLGDLYALEKVSSVEKRNEILRKARSSSDIAINAQYAVRDEKRDRNLKELKKMLKKAGIEHRQDEQYDLYQSDHKIVEEISLDEDLPTELKHTPGKDGNLYWCQQYGYKVTLFKHVKKKERELTEREKQEKLAEKNQRELNALKREAAAELNAYSRGVALGKIPAPPEEKIIPAIWKLLIASQRAVTIYTVFKGYTGYERWQTPEGAEDAETIDKKIELLPTAKQMLLVLGDIAEDLRINVRYKTGTEGKTCSALLEALDSFGFVFSDEKYRAVFDGTSELFMREGK